MSGTGSPIRIDEIGDLDALRRLRQAWEVLWRRAPGATPFSSPAWVLPWCDELGGVEPWAIAAWRDGALVALAPTFVYRDERGRVLGLLGGGVSDYQDVLAQGPEAASAIVRHLVRRGDRYDLADLQSLAPWSLLPVAAAACRLRHRMAPDAVGAALPLPARFDDLARCTSRSLLHEVRYQRRRLEREGGLVVDRARTHAAREVAVEELFRLHAAQWRARGEPGVLAEERVQRFHRAATRELLEAGALRLVTLRVRGVAVAVRYGMMSHGRAYAYLFGTDPAEARRSLGSLAVAQAIEDAIAEGARELDFLRGEERYKTRWGAIPRRTLRLGFFPSEDAGGPARGRFPESERDDGMRAGPPRSS